MKRDANKNRWSFYPSFTAGADRYSPQDKECIEMLVERLVAVDTSAAWPGMLLAKIQSGKTKTFLAAVALSFDNGFDIAIVLTKGTRALTKGRRPDTPVGLRSSTQCLLGNGSYLPTPRNCADEPSLRPIGTSDHFRHRPNKYLCHIRACEPLLCQQKRLCSRVQ